MVPAKKARRRGTRLSKEAREERKRQRCESDRPCNGASLLEASEKLAMLLTATPPRIDDAICVAAPSSDLQAELVRIIARHHGS